MQSPEYEGEQLTDDMRTVNVEASKSSARAASLLRLNGLGALARQWFASEKWRCHRGR